MKKRMIPLMLVLLLLAAGTCGCTGPLKQKALREAAEAHLAKLQRIVGDADHFTLESKKVSVADKSMYAMFHVDSETYGKSFIIFVPQDGSASLDDYFSLYLKAEAGERADAALRKTLEWAPSHDSPLRGDMKAEVTFRTSSPPAELSLHGAGTLDDLMAATAAYPVLEIRLVYSGRDLSEDEVEYVLCALQMDGIFCRVYPYKSDSVWFELQKDGCWRYKQSGADGGAMMDRQEYFPSVPAAD